MDGGVGISRREPLPRLFLRFLRFGALAWGGPVAQIAMIRQELVEDERWIGREEFNRVLAIYQVLPGPEAHELCVYFGMRVGGRMGGLLAGLGFMLPGFLLMFILSTLYLSGGGALLLGGLSAGIQPGVVALILRAVARIGRHALTNAWLWAIALLGTAAHAAGVTFWLTLSAAGLIHWLARRERRAPALLLLLGMGAAIAWAAIGTGIEGTPLVAEGIRRHGVSLLRLFWSGLRSGLLTFGGAYTVIPFLQHDAVSAGGWMTSSEFLDGLALSGILPAPLIIFATFVGYVGGGPLGAILLTVGIFLPAFGFTLAAHGAIEALMRKQQVHDVLDGITAGVVGLIAATAVGLAAAAIRGAADVAIAVVALLVLFRWSNKMAIPAVIAGAALTGWLLAR